MFLRSVARLRGGVAGWLAAAVCVLLTSACDRGDHPGRIGAAAPQFTVSDGSQTVDLARCAGMWWC